MTAAVPMLEDSLVWSTTGHLAEAAIAAVADGEGALLPQHAVQHAVTCGACSEQVGLAALFALEVAEAAGTAAPASTLSVQPVAEAARHEHSVKAPVPVLSSLPPLPAMVPAVFVVLALAAGAPLLATLRTSSAAQVLARLASVIAHATLVTRAPGVDELTWLAAVVLVVSGGWIARSAARAPTQTSPGLP